MTCVKLMKFDEIPKILWQSDWKVSIKTLNNIMDISRAFNRVWIRFNDILQTFSLSEVL